MSDVREMLAKAVEGVTRQFNAQVEASIAALVNSGIPLERIELINRTTADLSVETEVRSRTSDEAQAVAIEREAIARLVTRYSNHYAFHPEGPVASMALHELAQAIRNGTQDRDA